MRIIISGTKSSCPLGIRSSRDSLVHPMPCQGAGGTVGCEGREDCRRRGAYPAEQGNFREDTSAWQKPASAEWASRNKRDEGIGGRSSSKRATVPRSRAAKVCLQQCVPRPCCLAFPGQSVHLRNTGPYEDHLCRRGHSCGRRRQM